MTVVGLSFTKLHAEKKKPVKGKISVKNNVQIKEVSESKLTASSNQTALSFSFLYTSSYDPEVGSIEIAGNTVYVVPEKIGSEILDQWKKEKKVDPKHAKGLLNHILSKCNVQAIVLSRDLNLPAPVPLPKMK